MIVNLVIGTDPRHDCDIGIREGQEGIAVRDEDQMSIALLDVVTATLVLQRTLKGGYALLGFGILALPPGPPALYEEYRQAENEA